MNWDVVCADVLDWAAGYSGEPFHAILCDPPYHLSEPITQRFGTAQRNGGKWAQEDKQRRKGFMGKHWDGGSIAFDPATWAALAEHLHPGGFILAFGGSRTYHRLACAVEDAGLVVHPALVWLQGQGFPKATRIDTQIDKAAGAERTETKPNKWNTVKGTKGNNGQYVKDGYVSHGGIAFDETLPATPLAATWAGHRYGLQALKPCAEFILCAQKPYAGKPVDSIVATGAGALWIDGARVGYDSSEQIDFDRVQGGVTLGAGSVAYTKSISHEKEEYTKAQVKLWKPEGRWPPNVCLSHVAPHPCPACGQTGVKFAADWSVPRSDEEHRAYCAANPCPDCGGSGWLEGCRRVGTRRVRGTPKSYIRKADGKGKTSYQHGQSAGEFSLNYADPDGLETVDDWLCVEGCPVRELGEMSGERKGSTPGTIYTTPRYTGTAYANGRIGGIQKEFGYGDTGTAARFYPNHDWRYEIAERLAGVTPFYYVAKAGRRERDAGLDGMPLKQGGTMDGGHVVSEGRTAPKTGRVNVRNPHPTVKPIALTKWLATLLLPPSEYAPRRILVPFSGSGSEMIGCGLAGFEEIIGVEMEPEYCDIARARLTHWLAVIQQEMDL